MLLQRRGMLTGLFMAPAIVQPNVLMPISTRCMPRTRAWQCHMVFLDAQGKVYDEQWFTVDTKDFFVVDNLYSAGGVSMTLTPAMTVRPADLPRGDAYG